MRQIQSQIRISLLVKCSDAVGIYKCWVVLCLLKECGRTDLVRNSSVCLVGPDRDPEGWSPSSIMGC